jgi:hypothetical protein
MTNAAPTSDPPAPPEAEQDYCPRCGTAYEPLQEYCLECGERLPVNRGLVGVLASGWQRRFSWYPGDWIWPTIVFAGIAAVAAALAIVLGGGSSSSAGSTINAASNSIPLGPGAVSPSVATSTVNTATLPTPPEPTTGRTTTPRPPKPRPNPNALAVWPAGRSGYTIVLESLPTAGGRAAAIERARRAKSAGLPQVGVLDSSNYSSLHPGYYVVFSGIYSAFGDAQAAVSNAHAKGFRDAFPRQVTR